jgi:hypothetical protein
MLADADGALRRASVSEQQSQLVEEDQERLAHGRIRATGGDVGAEREHRA